MLASQKIGVNPKVNWHSFTDLGRMKTRLALWACVLEGRFGICLDGGPQEEYY